MSYRPSRARIQSDQEKRLRELVELGESDVTEFKRRFSTFSKMAKELIAFANSKGGSILLGVDDDGSFVGVDSEKHEIELISTAAEFHCDPPVEIDVEVVELDRIDVVAVHVQESDRKPHFLVEEQTDKDSERARLPVAYVRQKDRSVTASREVTKLLASLVPGIEPLQIHIGKIERALFDYLEKNDRITLKEYRQFVNISERRASRLLVRLVRAGLISLFTEESTDYYTLP